MPNPLPCEWPNIIITAKSHGSIFFPCCYDLIRSNLQRNKNFFVCLSFFDDIQKYAFVISFCLHLRCCFFYSVSLCVLRKEISGFIVYSHKTKKAGGRKQKVIKVNEEWIIAFNGFMRSLSRFEWQQKTESGKEMRQRFTSIR